MNKKKFAVVLRTYCLVAMIHAGEIPSHPDYIYEKAKMSADPASAWGWLDGDRQATVKSWFAYWNVGAIFDEMLAELIHDYNHMPSDDYREKWMK